VVVLAAGSGTRMRSKRAKVLHQLGGRSMVGHVLSAAGEVDPERLVVVVGHGRDEVAAHLRELAPDVVVAVQETQEGTGHAMRVAMAALQEQAGAPRGTVVVLYGDTPLLQGSTIAALVEDHQQSGRAVTLLSGVVADPFGYGRVVRDGGEVAAVVEERDATDAQRGIAEVNSGVYAFDAGFLVGALERLTNDNAKREYYLTDLVGFAVADGAGVGAHLLDDVAQTEGANDRVQLAALGRELNRRTLLRWMRAGVTVVDPDTTWVDVDVTLAPDVTLLPGVQLLGATSVAEDAVVGPDCTLKDVEVGRGAKVVRSHGELAVVGDGANVGPFSYLRPGTMLGTGGKIGAFVETKNAQIGRGAKVPHLSYVGDAEIGEGTNIGAGTVFANYDGLAKHRTTVGRYAKTGSNNTFVAPVRIGDGAVTGGGTVVRRDVPPGALAVSAPDERHVEGWVLAKRPDTPAAEAAEAAGAAAAPEQRDSQPRGVDSRAPGSQST
jgi:bifunctional UDP-N-acetylglucosamine pyrophosphorylase/glucosamine-1-phosphate N-acetyltransferase